MPEMKHLEELKKELQIALEENFHSADISIEEFEKCKTTGNYKICHDALLKSWLQGRKILQAYDAIEERKCQLKNVSSQTITLYSNPSKSISYHNDPELYKKNYQEENVLGFAYLIKISDYEWNWLKQQEEEKDE